MFTPAAQRSPDAAEPNGASRAASSSAPLDEVATTRNFLKPSWPIESVRTQRQLESLCKKLNRAELFSVDTETWGPKVLSDQLCLIQISIPPEADRKASGAGGRVKRRSGARPRKSDGTTYLVDVVALEAQATADGKGANPLSALKGVLEDPNKVKVIHHAQFEESQFIKYGISLAGVLDTKLVAKKVRADLVSHSLQACVFEILGLEMSKEEQTSKWVQRPLTEAQIQYAALDSEVVLHLLGKLRSLERQTIPSQAWSLDTVLEKLAETRRERQQLFAEHGVATTMQALDELVFKTRQTLTELLKYEASKGVSANYRGKYGTAMYRQYPVEEASVAKLQELVPNLIPEVVRETTTKKALGEALAALGRQAELKQLWDDLQVEAGGRTPPKLTIQLAADGASSQPATSRKKSSATQPASPPPLEVSKEELMQTLLEAEIGKLQVVRTHGLGDRLAILDGRIERYAERVLELLEQINPEGASHTGPHGTAAFTTNPVVRLDVETLKRDHPVVASRCLTPQITKGRVVGALRALGADPATTARVLGEVFVKTGEVSSPRVYVVPNYALFYKGIELDPEVTASPEDDSEGIA